MKFVMITISSVTIWLNGYAVGRQVHFMRWLKSAARSSLDKGRSA